MNVTLQLRIMLGALRKNALRTVLALAAVGLGTASMMIMLALGRGAELELQAIVERSGKNLFMIKAGQVQAVAGRGQGWFTSTKLTADDANQLADRIHAVRVVVSVLEGSLQVKLHARELVTSVRGVTPEFVTARNFRLDSGRLLDELDGTGLKRVAVVGPFVAQRLNDGNSMVGKTIWVAGAAFRVVGQLAPKGLSSDGSNEDDQILVPLQTALRRVFNVDYLSRLLVQVQAADQIESVQREARVLLRESHDLDAGVADDFEILSLIKSDAISSRNSQFLKGMSQLFAAITLAIGGAGVFAVTYLNIKDRTAEIGLRMAVGAKRRDIAVLFTAEACLIGLMGGACGLLIGALAVFVLQAATHWQLAIDVSGIVLPLLISALLGLIFGVVPAMKASRLAPVAALKST